MRASTELMVGALVVGVLSFLVFFSAINFVTKATKAVDIVKRQAGGMMGVLKLAETTCQVWEACSYYDPVALSSDNIKVLSEITDNIPCSIDYPGGCEQICACLKRLSTACDIGGDGGNAALCANSRCRIEIT